MLPKNRLAAAQLRKLKVYAGPEHPHAAQAPKTLELEEGVGTRADARLTPTRFPHARRDRHLSRHRQAQDVRGARDPPAR